MNTSLPTPLELLQNLVQFDTTNPPGNEAACIGYIDGLLQSAGIETSLYEKAPDRPNLVARLAGEGKAPPLLLYGHVDVVTTVNQDWTHPPFEGRIADGFLWGRGALDMKGGVAMMLSAFLRAKAEGISLPGDVIFLALSDEEAGGDAGAKFMVEEHASLFEGVRYAIGEFGGFNLSIGGKNFYAIQVAEKQICWTRAVIRGPAGHGSVPLREGAMARLGQVLTALTQNRLPMHVTPVADLMLDSIANHLGFPTGFLIRRLMDPRMSGAMFNLLKEQVAVFDPILHNTASPTILRGGDKINVHPTDISLEIDGRLLPGFGPEQFFAELTALAGDDVAFEVVRHDPYPAEPDMGLFETLGAILKEADPTGIPIPLLMPGVTDGRYLARLGIQTYGFTPVKLPADLNFVRTIHAADERIPVEGVEFGTSAIYKALQRFGEGV